jgi:thiosulfate/3-mercaptopyruvate sulfurtransferase
MTLVTPLVGVAELQAALAGPDDRRPTLLDVRWALGSTTGAAEHQAAHIPGAAFVDLDDALSGPVLPDGHGGRHPVPDTEHFARAMRAAGVRADRPVVCYDAGSSLGASRAWWMLTFFGKPDVRVLDGGLTAWEEAGLPTESGEVHPEPGTFLPRAGGRRLLDADGAAGHPLLLDARPADRYRGENETIDPVAGHIPGARSAPALDNLRPDGRFLPPVSLAERMAAVGVRPGDDVAVYCGSGVQAAHTALALQVAGVTDDAAVYVGSWSDWVSDRTRPVELG